MKRRFWLSSLAAGSVGLISCGPETSPMEPSVTAEKPALAASLNAGGTWTTKASMPTPRSFLAAAVHNNSSGQPVLYAIGGFDPGAGITRAVESYNFATNQWSTKARLPLALSNTNGIGVIGGKLYLSGGAFETADGLSGWHPGLNVYDPATNSWTKRADMPKRFGQGVTGVINGKLYVLSGTCNNCGPERITRRLYRYDPATNVWTPLAWAPTAHVLGAGAVINGKFYVAGGLGSDNRASNKLEAYDPTTGRWTTLAPMPTPRYGAAGAALENKLYIIGKSNADPGEPQGVVEAFDPVTNTWTTHTPMPGAGRGDLAAATVTYLGKSHILAVGGSDVEGSSSGSVNQAFIP